MSRRGRTQSTHSNGGIRLLTAQPYQYMEQVVFNSWQQNAATTFKKPQEAIWTSE